MRRLLLKQNSPLPGFGLTLGFTMFYLSLIVLIPLSALFVKTSSLTWDRFIEIVTSPRVVASYKLTFGASLAGACINAVFGFIVAWALARYVFPFKRVIDAMVDIPFAMPTAVSGIALTAIYSANGWVGQFVAPGTFLGNRFGEKGLALAFSPIGVMIALTFIGLPFVVRTLQPAIEDLDAELEEAAASLGASRWQTFRRVIFPALFPPLLTGFALSFARALGEYGSVVFISGNKPFQTEISSLLIIMKLEEYDYPGATAIAVVMLMASFLMLLTINILQWWAGRGYREAK